MTVMELKLLKDLALRESIQEKIQNPHFLSEIIQASQKLKISLVMLVKNQESGITEVLERLKLLELDAYHVVDTGSTDNTVQVLQNIDDVALHSIPWVEDYGYMRNQAAKFANSDWLLIMDSDELLGTKDLDLRLLVTLLENTISEPFSINFEQHNQNSAHISVPARLYNKANSNFFGLVHEELRDIKTDEPVFGILTKIVIENAGSSQDEVAKFSKNERYYRLLMKMIELDSSNPRWFAHLSPYAIQALIQESKYEPLLIKYLFKNQEVLIEKDAILISPYTSNLFERYITLLYTKKEFEAAKKVAEFALTMYPENSSLMFNSALAEIGKIQLDIKRAMKTTLGRYLVLNKQDAYENNLCDTESLKLALAELNSMNGNYQIAEQIISDIKDENLLNIWELWHPIQK